MSPVWAFFSVTEVVPDMKRLYTKDNPVAGSTYTLQAVNMPSGMFIDKFYLKLSMTFTLGGAPLTHQQEAMAECISRIFSNEGNLRADISAQSLLILESQRERSRCALNPKCDALGTPYILYIPFDPAPFGGFPGAANDRFKTSELAKQGLDVTLANPFGAADRVPTFTKLELYGSFTKNGPAQTKYESEGLISNYKEVTGIESDILAVTSVQPAMMLINTRDTDVPAPFTRLDITGEDFVNGGGITLAQNATSLDLDAKDQQFDKNLWNDDRTVGGNQLLQDILKADGITVLNLTKLYDARNPGDAAAVTPIAIEFQSKATNNIKYIICGYIKGGAQTA